jgi:amidophosphoribosyltransferase
MVTQGAKVDLNGQVVPEESPSVKTVNGDANGYARSKREREESGTPPVRHRHDIRYVNSLKKAISEANNNGSLHNFVTDPHRGYE